MARRRLLALVGLAIIGVLAYRRRLRRDVTEIEIDDRGTRERSTGDERPAVELRSVDGIGPAYEEQLRAAGVDDVGDLVAANPEHLASETGIGERRIRTWIERLDDRGGG